jgi:regulator of ribonuclease activity A
MSFKTADLSDVHSDNLKAAGDVFKSFGLKKRFSGTITTVKVYEDNVLVKAALETNGTGKVLVVDGGGSLHMALMGDNLATLAINNGWEGVIINGAIRDSADINEMEVGVKALGTHPFKSIKKGEGQNDVTVTFAGIEFVPGEYLYSDEDGIVVAKAKLD